MELFSTTPSLSSKPRREPLAARIRPEEFSEIVGQDHLVGPNGILSQALKNQKIHSFILWGPPGTGKTTIAQILARKSGFAFVPFSAVLSGIREVRNVMKEAEHTKRHGARQTLVFVDEIHRFNKAQQDAFLPFVERGDIVLIGATTENPSFEVISPLLSRLRVYVLNPLSTKDQIKILKRSLAQDIEMKNRSVHIADSVLEYIASRVPGDARSALNLLEASLSIVPKDQDIEKKHVDQASQRTALLYDKAGEEHYNVISALHKSMRNGDAQASVYWLGRMLEAGEDPLYIVRRMVRFASEDVGNADPQALVVAIAARDSVHFLGMPEGKLALAQLAVYLANAPKSNAVYRAYQEVEKDIHDGHVYSVPLHIRNAPTKLMKDLGYGHGYDYAHHHKEKTTAMDCLPSELVGRQYYKPTNSGAEKEIKWRQENFEKLREGLKEQNLREEKRERLSEK